jgi:hypothetical protein
MTGIRVWISRDKIVWFASDDRAGTIASAARLVLTLQFPTVQL